MKVSLGSAVLLCGAVVGYLTGVNSLSRAGQIPADGKWMQGAVNAKDPFALYAIGHFRQEGSLPPSHAALYFTRAVDDEGNGLRSTCTYQLSGHQPAARWWSISAGPAGHGVGQASFTARDAVLSSDDGLELAISRRAAPGNWLEIDDFGAMQITLVMDEPYPIGKAGKLSLPALKRMVCE
jgi:hypothetical protein